MLIRAATVMRSRCATAAGLPVPGGELRNRMRKFFTSGSVGGGGGNPGPYPEADKAREFQEYKAVRIFLAIREGQRRTLCIPCR